MKVRITVPLHGSASIFNKNQTKLRHKLHTRIAMLGANVDTSSRRGRSLHLYHDKSESTL